MYFVWFKTFGFPKIKPFDIGFHISWINILLNFYKYPKKMNPDTSSINKHNKFFIFWYVFIEKPYSEKSIEDLEIEDFHLPKKVEVFEITEFKNFSRKNEPEEESLSLSIQNERKNSKNISMEGDKEQSLKLRSFNSPMPTSLLDGVYWRKSNSRYNIKDGKKMDEISETDKKTQKPIFQTAGDLLVGY